MGEKAENKIPNIQLPILIKFGSDMLRKFEKLTRKIYMSLIGPIFIISILAITKSHFAKQCYITEFQLDETLQ